MNRPTASLLLLAGIGAAASAGYSVYKTRRQWIGRLLHLPPARFEVGVERHVRVPMPDGIMLEAEHYYPKTDGSFPTILIRTPYGLSSDQPKFNDLIRNFPVQRLVERGYHVVVQSVRGRYGSGGKFIPFFSERADGRASLEWIAKQPWFNDSLGMFGGSYPGYVQWAVAADAPPYLKAMVPAITAANLTSAFWPVDDTLGLDVTVHWMLSTIWVNALHLPPLRKTLMTLPWGQEQHLQKAIHHLPLNELDQVVTGQRLDFFREWIQHASARDEYWRDVDFRRDSLSVNTDVPVHLIAAWYDIFTQYQLEDYQALKAAGRQPYLTIAATWHLNPSNYVIGVQEGLAWLDAHLKNDPSHLRRHPVRIFVMGNDAWREMDDWPPPAQVTRYYLQANRRLAIDRPAEVSPPDRYIFDPSSPTPVVGGSLLSFAAGPRDQRPLESRPDVITYTTDPLQEDVEVIGNPRVELYVQSSLTYTDFAARLCDVHPDGSSINLCDGLLRIAPGVGEVQADGSLKIAIELWPTANCFLRGHRIRLQVCSGGHPRWSRNPGTGEPLATGTRLQAANQTIYHDQAHPSVLWLPVTSWWIDQADIEAVQFA